MDVPNKYMQRCIELAGLGAGYVSPNPMVGAVIVHADKIIGEGYHQKYGGPHAEVNAINAVLSNHINAAELLKQSTIYVSLEPCAHYGKTPPCADLIIKHQIPEVVIGCRDPFNQVNGRGIEKLKETGIKVTTDILEAECRELNKRFFIRVQKQRPYIVLKWAQTTDGFLAPADGSQFWITGHEAQTLVHKWRTEEDAILIGKNTVITDNPLLNNRLWSGNAPKRVIIDRRLEIPKDMHIYKAGVETLIFNEVKTDVEDNIKFIALEDFDRFVPEYIMYQLYLQDIQSVIIEGGAYTLNKFIEADLWDEARIFTGAKILSGGIKAPEVAGERSAVYRIGNDEAQLVYNSELS